jgi:putative flippase GtrA
MSNKKQALTFIIVGGINSIIDFSIFNVLLALKIPLSSAIFIAAVVAMIISYLLNSRFTFQKKAASPRIVLFFLVTTTGIVLRYLISLLITKTLLDNFVISTSNNIYHITSLMFIRNISVWNLHNAIIWGVSILIAMIYNFILYKKVVFK